VKLHKVSAFTASQARAILQIASKLLLGNESFQGIYLLRKYRAKKPENQVAHKHTTTSKQKEFLSPAEKEFKEYLRQHLPEEIEIHCKVRLADILNTETTYRRIIMMHVDFVLLDANTQKIILVLELDDKSHDTEKAKERDAIKNEALRQSGIKYTRIPNKEKYNPTIIKNIVDFCSNKLTGTTSFHN
jgi:very-short-patch-repair endonuclease